MKMSSKFTLLLSCLVLPGCSFNFTPLPPGFSNNSVSSILSSETSQESDENSSETVSIEESSVISSETSNEESSSQSSSYEEISPDFDENDETEFHPTSLIDINMDFPKEPLVIWGSNTDISILQKLIDEYNSKQPIEEYKFKENTYIERDTVYTSIYLTGQEQTSDPLPDIFSLVNSSTLDGFDKKFASRITGDYRNNILYRNYDFAVRGSSLNFNDNLRLYAIPKHFYGADNLFYNQNFYSESDVTDLEKILEIAKISNKKVLIQLEGYNSFYKFLMSESALGRESFSWFYNKNLEKVSSTTWDSDRGIEIIKRLNEILGPYYQSGVIATVYGHDVAASMFESGEAIANFTYYNFKQFCYDENVVRTLFPTYTFNDETIPMISDVLYEQFHIGTDEAKHETALALLELYFSEQNQIEIFNNEYANYIPAYKGLLSKLDNSNEFYYSNRAAVLNQIEKGAIDSYFYNPNDCSGGMVPIINKVLNHDPNETFDWAEFIKKQCYNYRNNIWLYP